MLGELRANQYWQSTPANKSHRQNPYNGIVFRGCTRPPLQSTDLLSSGPQVLGEKTWTRLLRSAFEEHAATWRVALPFIKPAAGDLQLVHADGESTIIVEAKQCSLIVQSEKTWQFGNPLYDPATGLRSKRLQTFLSPADQWDLLFITLSYKNLDQLFVFARDEIPPSWYQALPPPIFSMEMETPATEKYCDLHHIKQQKPREFVQRLEAILDHHRIRKQATPRTSREIETLPFLSRIKMVQDTAEQEAEIEELNGVEVRATRAPRGLGRQWSRQEWETRQMEWLHRETRRW